MALRPGDWRPAQGVDPAARRRGAQVAELDVTLAGWPYGTRAIVRRVRPHPGAQLRLWDHNGWRHQVTLTNTGGEAAALKARHRRHAQVENRIKNLKACGLERMPFTSFAANQAWMEMTLAAADLLTWLQACSSTATSPGSSPAPCATGSCTSPPAWSARQAWMRLPVRGPWAADANAAYERLALIGA